LDRLDGFDPEASVTFKRSAYRVLVLTTKLTREQLFAKWDGAEKTQVLARPTGQAPMQ
jgi:hypothetical protein